MSRYLHLHVDAEILEALKKPFGDLVLVASGEVLWPEVVILDAVAEHEICGREHRSGDGENRFLRSTTALEAKKLGLEITPLLPGRAPRRLDQGGLEPRGAMAGGVGSDGCPRSHQRV